MSVAGAGQFTQNSRIRDVLRAKGDVAERLLYRYGFDLGEGFTDVLSQYQTLEMAYRTGRLRDLDELITELNAS